MRGRVGEAEVAVAGLTSLSLATAISSPVPPPPLQSVRSKGDDGNE